MKSNGNRIHFGDYFRQCVMERVKALRLKRGGERVTIREVLADANLDHATAYRYFGLAGDPDAPLPIDHFNESAAATAAGYEHFWELDEDWRKNPVAVYVPRGSVPKWVDRAQRAGTLPIQQSSPTAVVQALSQLDSDAQLAVIKSLSADILAEAANQQRTARSISKPQGVLLNHQLDALAAAPDIETFEKVVKEIRKQLKNGTAPASGRIG